MLRKFLYGLLGFLVGTFVIGLVIFAQVLNKIPELSPVVGWIFILLCGVGGGVIGVRIANRLNTQIPSGESHASLRWFFILAGVAGIYSILQMKSYPDLNAGIGVLGIISAAFSLITFYIGIRFNSMIHNNYKFILNFLYIGLVYSVIVVIVYPIIFGGSYVPMVVAAVVSTIIQIVIIRNVKKLSLPQSPVRE